MVPMVTILEPVEKYMYNKYYIEMKEVNYASNLNGVYHL